MTKALWALVLGALTLSAGEVSGKWTGTMSFDRDGEMVKRSVYLDLKQDGSKLTGNVGHEGSDPIPIEAGAVDGTAIRFQIKPPDNPDSPITFELTVDGDRISGQLRQDHEGHSRKAELEAKRSQ